MSGGAGFDRELAAFRLILDLVPVAGHPPRGSVQQLERLQRLDPEAAERIIEQGGERG
ncbi:hypothetical protein [Actinoallomurus sp. CA-150999]|uniref:hypothetical protein n=1 Tax=Actinoallomurus sp. CA-150999 TaxID=3239887 RepID=UPI003D90660F